MSRIISSIWRSREYRILILGLDGAGKTTLLYRLHIGDVLLSIPTIGFNMETLVYQNTRLQVWDIGGQTTIRPYWRCYYLNTDAIVYVIDSVDEDRLETNKIELMGLLKEEELKNAALLILANKQDLPNALSAGAIIEALGLSSIRDRSWKIQNTSIVQNEGITEGFDWLVSKIH